MASFFPLPPVARPWVEHRASDLCKDVRRRLFLKNLLLDLVGHAVESLNFCGLRTLRRGRRASSDRKLLPPTSAAQQSVLDRVFRRCLGAGLPPRQSCQGALRELLRVQSLDEVADASGVVPFEWDKLKLLRESWEVVPRQVCSVAPPEVCKWFQRPGQFRLSAEQARAVSESVAVPAPYWDVQLAADRKLRE